MTRLMSHCVVATVAAKKQVAAPMNITTPCATSDVSNIGDRRQTMNTPAVTIVAAWISADTGVGPSIASGSQVCRSEEHTSELQSLMRISYAVFCLKKKNPTHKKTTNTHRKQTHCTQ